MAERGRERERVKKVGGAHIKKGPGLKRWDFEESVCIANKPS